MVRYRVWCERSQSSAFGAVAAYLKDPKFKSGFRHYCIEEIGQAAVDKLNAEAGPNLYYELRLWDQSSKHKGRR
jgi:hypothetical protein